MPPGLGGRQPSQRLVVFNRRFLQVILLQSGGRLAHEHIRSPGGDEEAA